MAYRSGTYVAFDGLGQIDPSKSDFKYYATIQAWDKNKDIDFKYIDSHDKTYAIRDSSKKETVKSRIRERLANSKNTLVILSSDTRKSGSILSYEIEESADNYKLPLIITYVDYRIVVNPDQLSGYWPYSLSSRIGNSVVRVIHIPFVKGAILDAIGQFNMNNMPATAKNYYSEKAHRNFGAMGAGERFTNTRK